MPSVLGTREGVDKVMLDRTRRRRGLATAIAILVLTVAMAVAFSMCDMTAQILRLSSTDTWGDRARLAAEGGACDAMAQVKINQAWNAGFAGKALPTDTSTKYTVLVTNNIGGSAAVVASDGTMVPVGLVYLKSSGTAGNVTRNVDVMVQVTPGVNPYSYGLFETGSGGLNIFKATIDSYDSSVVPIAYGDDAVIGANGPIDINQQASVQGDAYYVGSFSPDPPPADLTPHPLNSAMTWPDVTFTAPPGGTDRTINIDTTLSPGAYRNVSVSNNRRLTLVAGTYYMQDFTLNNNTRVTLSSGPVIVYFSGVMTVRQNATVNAGGRPQNMQFYSSNSSATSPGVVFDNNGVVVATVYAPQAMMTLRNNGVFFGSLVARETTLSNNSIIHYDTSLSSQTGPFGGASTLTVLSWDLH